jgi:hypothetical protein
LGLGDRFFALKMPFCQYARVTANIYLDLPNQAVTCFLAPLTGGLALRAEGSAKCQNKFSRRTRMGIFTLTRDLIKKAHITNKTDELKLVQ